MTIYSDPEFIFAVGAIITCYLMDSMFNLSHKLLTGLKFWKPPSNAVLESFKRDEEPKDEKKGGRRKRKKQAALASLEKKETGLELELGIISEDLLVMQEGYMSFSSFSTLFGVAVLTFAFHEVWACLTRDQTSDFSLLVMTCTAGFGVYYLIALLVAPGFMCYQVRISLIAGFVMLLLAYGSLSLPASILDIRLQEGAYEQFTEQVNKVLAMVKVHGMKPPQDSTSSAGAPATVYVGDLITYAVPEAYYYILLSFTASVISAVTLMPCMRSAKCYQHILDHPRIPQYKTYSLYALTRLLCHLNALVLPALCILFWLPPMTKDLIVVDNSLMSEAVFDSMRMYLVLVTVFLRVALVHEHIQAYLLSAIYTISERADSLSSKTVLSIQELLTSILLFTPTMAMQYCASASVPLLLACMLKLKTGLCLGLCDVLVGSDGEASNFTLSSSSSSSSAASSDGDGASVDAASGEREAMLAQKEVRSLMIGNHPLAVPSLEFLLWWSFVSWFIMHSLCLLYVRHSAKQRSLDAENTESEGEADESEMVNFTKKNR